jgi:hypothetical protein
MGLATIHCSAATAVPSEAFERLGRKEVPVIVTSHPRSSIDRFAAQRRDVIRAAGMKVE